MKNIFYLIFLANLVNILCDNEIIYKIDKLPQFLQTENPDIGAAMAGGGDSGEFVRKNQPQEHILIPLQNSLEAEYNPFFDLDIKKFRQRLLRIGDRDLQSRAKLSKELDSKILLNPNNKGKAEQMKKGISKKVIEAIGNYYS